MSLKDFLDVKIRKIVRGKVPVKVSFADEVLNKIKEESKHFTREIAAIGKAEFKDGVWYVHYDLIPKQERYSYLVKVLDFPKGYDAVFHLHPLGVKSFSSVDYEYLNQNYVISVVVDIEGDGNVCYRDDENECFVVDSFKFSF